VTEPAPDAPAPGESARPIPHWPGRVADLGGGERVWLTETNPANPSRGAGPPSAGPGGEGSGRDVVVCVHGMSGAATNWTDLMGELAPDFDCVALDLPGSGFSPPPRRMSGYSVGALAGTVIRLIEALAVGPVHLFGNSMGGAIALRVAARRPDLVRTLTLISPVLPDRRLNPATAHFPVISVPLLGDWIVERYVRRYPAENRVAGVFATCYYDASRVHPERFALEVEELRRRDGLSYGIRSLTRAARTLTAETLRPRRLSLWRAAERLRAPALVLFGSHDRLVSPRLAGPAARAFRNARVVVLPESGHIAQMEHPAAVARLFREMVDEARAEGNVGHRNRVDA
jgi:pimeloyl-ACP methyl ester carboxylesterase